MTAAVVPGDARPMRILLWYWGRRGGGAQFALGLARALSRRPDIAVELSLSAQVELLDSFREVGAPIRLVRTYRGIPGFLAAMPRIPALARDLASQARGCDVVLSAMTHLWTPVVAPRLAQAAVPFVPVVHDADPHPGDFALAWKWRLARELAAAHAAVVLSEAVARAMRHHAPDLPLIRMPLPSLIVGPQDRPRRAAEPGGFLFFGRMRAYKGLDLLRDAFRLLRAQHPTASLRVVGEGDADALAPGLAGLPGVTVECRWVPDLEIAELLAGAEAVVLPYREASQSGVVPQALALGVPVVATPVGGLAEQVGTGRGGLLAEDVTAPALAAAMSDALQPGTLDRLRREARQAARNATDWDGAADLLVTGLRAALATPR